jgi:hypothetical protein
MFYASIAKFNMFSIIGGVSEHGVYRAGKFRAQGAFAHPILAGNIGAVSFPLFFILLRSAENRKKLLGYLGIVASFAMIVTCGSSGPILTLMVCITSMILWHWRNSIRTIKWIGIILIVVLHIYMYDPVWYLAARIDLVGGSTGWHRARLISAAIENLGEWWLVGTEYTRHWMPTGVSWNPNHTDITNQYILIGVNGGLLPIILFGLIIRKGFKMAGEMRSHLEAMSGPSALSIWVLGSVLFTHAVTFMSVAYFDQTISFFYGLIGIISSLYNYYSTATDL